jgi:hypothetical protein
VAHITEMITRIFCLQTTFPELFERSIKPIEDIPVFFDDRTIATTSLNPNGEFPIRFPYSIERKVGRHRHLFVPEYQELNQNPDPAKIKIRITGIRVTEYDH